MSNNCYYTYANLKKPTIQEILSEQAVIDRILYESHNKLLFYSSDNKFLDTTSKIQQIVQNAKSTHSAVSVTNIIHNALRNPTSVGLSGTAGVYEDIKKRFYTEYGTLIHACIGSKHQPSLGSNVSHIFKPYGECVEDLYNHLQNLKKEYDIFMKNHPDYKANFKIEPLESENMPSSIEELIFQFDELYKSLGLDKYTVGENLFFEVPVSFEHNNVKYKGVIDCLLVDPKGNVTIIDFKSTQKLYSADISDQTKESYLLQLKLYEAILEHNGIQGSITTEIKPIIAKGKTLTVMNDNVLSTDSSAYFNANAAMYSRVSEIVDNYFPNKNNLTDKEVNEQRVSIEKGLKRVFSVDYLNKDKEDPFKEFIVSRYANKEVLYRCYDKTISTSAVYLELEGDIITILKQSREPLKTMSIKEFVQKEIGAHNTTRHGIFSNIRKAIKNKDIKTLTTLLNRDSTLTNAKIEHVRKYLNPTWSILDSPIADDNNMLIFQNIYTGDIDIISLVPNVNLDYTYTFQDEDGKHHTRHVLGDALGTKVLNQFKDAECNASIANINALKTVLIFNAIRKNLNYGNNSKSPKLGQIMCLSDVNGDARHYNGKDLNDILYQAKILSVAKDRKMITAPELNPICDNIHEIKLTSAESYFITKVLNILNVVLDSKTIDHNLYTKYNKLVSHEGTLAEKINSLKELQKELERKFPQEFSKNKTVTRTNVTSDIQLLHDAVVEAIHRMSGGASFENLAEISSTGLDFNNSIRLANSIFKRNDINVTSGGVSLVGFMQGIDFASPYANPSEAVRELAQAHSYSVTQVQMELDDYVNGQNKAFAKWITTKQSILKSKLQKVDARIFLNSLVAKDNKGNYDKNFRFKNPFTDTSLTKEDAEYLKYCIWDILRIRKYVNSKDGLNDPKVKKMNYNELSKHPEYVKAFEKLLSEDKKSLNIPIRSASDGNLAWNGFTAALKGDFSKAKELYKTAKGKWMSVIDDRGITPEQEKEKKEHMKRLEAFNIYNEDAEARAKRLEGASIENFECNINYLVIDHAYNYVTCAVNQQILDQTDRMLSLISQVERHTGKDLSKHRQALLKRTAISMYNTNNIEDDYKDLAATIGLLRKVLNLSAIALRPALLAKELTVGRLKNTLSASLGYFENEGITFKHLMQAEKIVFSEGLSLSYLSSKKEIGRREKVEQVNGMYRIANRDANVMSQKAAASKDNIFGIDADLVYYTNTRPDWYNRMSIMVAKMIADGSWDAHIMDEDGRLKYDMAKDARYSIYWKYKDNPPKQGESDYKKYKEQEALYMWALNEFQKENIPNLEGEPLKSGDKLPRAYTGKETNSMKELIGLLYGYFNHEEKSIFQSETFSSLFMAFKTYWNSEWRYYFGMPNKNTSRGKVEHAKDPEGNLLYEEIDEATGVKFITTNAQNSKGEDNRAIMDWVATPTEGIAISFTKCIADLFTAEGRERLKNNPQQRKNAYIFLFRMLYWGFIAALMKWLLTGTDEDAYAVTKSLAILEKSAKDLNMFTSLGLGDLPFVGVENLQNLATGAFDSITDADGYDPSAFFSNISSINDILPE